MSKIEYLFRIESRVNDVVLYERLAKVFSENLKCGLVMHVGVGCVFICSMRFAC